MGKDSLPLGTKGKFSHFYKYLKSQAFYEQILYRISVPNLQRIYQDDIFSGTVSI